MDSSNVLLPLPIEKVEKYTLILNSFHIFGHTVHSNLSLSIAFFHFHFNLFEGTDRVPNRLTFAIP
jgi:hypothetical protein